MKLIADRMLGRLAKWLRALGLDVYYSPDIERSEFFRIAKEEKRLILTRAQNFKELKHIPDYIIIKAEILRDQLKEISELVKDTVSEETLFTRCLNCNERLEDISREDAAGRVPQRSYNCYNTYKRCPKCDKIYWSGTHVDRMKEMLIRYRI